MQSHPDSIEGHGTTHERASYFPSGDAAARALGFGAKCQQDPVGSREGEPTETSRSRRLYARNFSEPQRYPVRGMIVRLPLISIE